MILSKILCVAEGEDSDDDTFVDFDEAEVYNSEDLVNLSTKDNNG